MTTTSPRALVLGDKRYPVVLPRLGDPRLHIAAVVISLHVLGQVGLGFRVSVPQILAAIVTAAVIEVVWTFVRSRQLVWPASAMLTGSGVALIFRMVGTARGDHWTWAGWYLFAAVAAGSVLSKYLIRFRGTHLFNPSNLGLVVAFLVLGSGRVEPLDFWWSPLDGWMVTAYLVILVGGLVITSRLRLLGMAVTFWAVLAAGLGLLTATGHCIATTWSLVPVCGSSFWWVVVTSPEVAVFLFFMITDPKTVPLGRTARLGFAAAIALLAVMLMAPQTTEFGSKVALLSALVLLSPVRSGFDRLVPESDSGPWSALVARVTRGVEGAARPIFLRGVIAGSLLTVGALAVVAAGTPARRPVESVAAPAPVIHIDPATLPPVTIDPEVVALNGDLAADGGVRLGTILAEALGLEAEAMRRGDQTLLLSVDQGVRLSDLEQRIDAASADGMRVVDTYTFRSIHVNVMHGEGPQTVPGLAFETVGTVETATYAADGSPGDTTTSPVSLTFMMRQGSGDTWLIVDAVPTSAG